MYLMIWSSLNRTTIKRYGGAGHYSLVRTQNPLQPPPPRFQNLIRATEPTLLHWAASFGKCRHRRQTFPHLRLSHSLFQFYKHFHFLWKSILALVALGEALFLPLPKFYGFHLLVQTNSKVEGKMKYKKFRHSYVLGRSELQNDTVENCPTLSEKKTKTWVENSFLPIQISFKTTEQDFLREQKDEKSFSIEP